MSVERIFAALAGLFGAAGVGLMALASHGTWPTLVYAAIMVLVHAAALLALAAGLKIGLFNRRLAIAGGSLLAFAVALFAADVTLHAMTGERLFPMAAPSGGTLSILAWLAIGLAALL